LLFLKKPRALIQWGEDYKLQYLAELVRIQRAVAHPIILLPQPLIWDQKPEQYRKSIFDIVFGDPQAPGRIRKIISFIRNFRKAYVQIGHPIVLTDFLAENADSADTEALAQKLRWRLSSEFRIQEKAIRGPVLKGRNQICQEILRNPAVDAGIEQIAHGSGIPPAACRKRASMLLRNMAADFSFNYLEASCLLLTPIFHRLYSEIVVDQEGLQKIRDASRDAPLIIVPAHRSHIDYLLISYIFYTYGLIPPHIAAGDNLSFWPLGHIFRRDGAFFIRRSIKDDRLYKFLLGEYIKKLLKEGYWMEFFIEGTRSRTGKLLPPKFGILSMIVDGAIKSATEDIKFVPVSITYEQILEEGSYTSELTGREKKKENLGEFIKTPKVLKSKYGKVYFEFEKILSLKEFLAKENEEVVSLARVSSEGLSEGSLNKLAHTLMNLINKSIVVTPTAVVSFAILNHRGRGISREELLNKAGFIVFFIASKKGKLSDSITNALQAVGIELPGNGGEGVQTGFLLPDDAETPAKIESTGRALAGIIDDTLRIFFKKKDINLIEFSDDIVISPQDLKRINLDYYKNQVIHYFVQEALVSAAALHMKERKNLTFQSLREETKWLSRLFKYEFTYKTLESYDENFMETFGFFVDRRVFVDSGGGGVALKAGSEEVLSFFAGVILNFIESYMILFKTVANYSEAFFEKDILKESGALGEKLFQTGDVMCREAITYSSFRFALKFLIDAEIVETGVQTEKELVPLRVVEMAAPDIRAFIERLKSYREAIFKVKGRIL
ncbi:MAG: 1-acyl-sn-glycerol-3-phosphate acyltransferase, partial [Deltaproteobacteria bacterium]|nr:1-acyl-sn-glycerol-3-phosphate acyltransferase [Deltaproteobacteria bacterium]